MADLDFTSPERVIEHTPFVLDGEKLLAVKPKGGQLLALAKDVRALQAAHDELGQAEIIDRFMEMCMEPDSAARLTSRLTDPEDDFDLDTLTLIIERLQEVWTARPTGPSSGSSQRRRTTGRASTARVRSSA